MAISHVNSQAASNGNATSLAPNKPTGTASGDLLLAFFTSNDQNCTPPSGWAEISDTSIEVFRRQVFYKVAGGSEPSTYTFSVPAAAPLVVVVSCFRGIDTSDPFDIDPVASSALASSEAHSTPNVTGGSAGRLLYMRSVRFAGTTVPTFTASGVTEISDAGVFSGGTVCYSGGLYIATSDYSTSGSKSGLAITCSQAESHNLTLTLGIKASGVPGTMDLDLPSIPSVAIDGSSTVPGTMGATLPLLGPIDINVYNGTYNGPLAVDVPIAMDIQAYTDALGTVSTVIEPVFDFTAETRFVGDNVVNIVREHRWIILTQDDYREGIRDDRLSLFVVDLPLIDVSFDLFHITIGPSVPVTATAYDPAVTIGPPAGAVTSTVTG